MRSNNILNTDLRNKSQASTRTLFEFEHIRFTENSAYCNRNRNRELQISTAPKKRSRVYQLIGRRLTITKSIGSRSRSRESSRQADSQTAIVDGVWS